MTTSLEETAARLKLASLTVTQYEAMVASGALPEEPALELLEGLLVLKDRAEAGRDPMTIGEEHQYVVDLLSDLGPAFKRHGCCLRIQGPCRITPKSMPEPDVLVLIGPRERYAGKKHPGPHDARSVIEVADSSLERDRTVKLGIYAGAAIPQYVIVNLVDHQVEVYSDPSPSERVYNTRVVLTGGQQVALAAGGKKAVKVAARVLHR